MTLLGNRGQHGQGQQKSRESWRTQWRVTSYSGRTRPRIEMNYLGGGKGWGPGSTSCLAPSFLLDENSNAWNKIVKKGEWGLNSSSVVYFTFSPDQQDTFSLDHQGGPMGGRGRGKTFLLYFICFLVCFGTHSSFNAPIPTIQQKSLNDKQNIFKYQPAMRIFEYLLHYFKYVQTNRLGSNRHFSLKQCL